MQKRFLSWLKFKKEKFSSLKISKNFQKRISALNKLLGYNVNDPNFYLEALTHRSYLERSDTLKTSNERLEFLGDAVLGLITAEYLFENYSSKGEGFLTKSRSQLVDRTALIEAATKMKLEELIFFDDRFINHSHEGLNTIKANSLEALIGAVYMDKDLEEAENFILKRIIEPMIENGKFQQDKNFKGKLLEYTHTNKLIPPKYKIISEEGPHHKKLFSVEVFVDNESYGIGKGKSKKIAEQNASESALIKLNVST